MELKWFLGIVGVGEACINVLFCYLALILDDWIDHSPFPRVGLWTGWSDMPSWVKPTRAMMFLGLFATIGTTVTASIFVKKNIKVFLFITIGLAVVSGIFMLAGYLIFSEATSHLGLRGGNGSSFCIRACILAWGIAITYAFVFILSKRELPPANLVHASLNPLETHM
ncbi:uncharacterized protein LOC128236239 isoform X1 [Mya arenaria]|uniref:uncharacterized protein LOC128236239 isoform X1 n=1 Tax=Mya arenaria TaxID=6604 RepID=UPI0022E43969|nr:uncharacterized protein LOC128236239 isoform X1 [Mya arenaria]